MCGFEFTDIPFKITKEFLEKNLWKYSHQGGLVSSTNLRFLPDGRIGGYTHPNETFWRLDNGLLSFIKDDGRTISTTFTTIAMEGGQIVLSGLYLLDRKRNITLRLEPISWETREKLHTNTKLFFKKQIAMYGWTIGDHTYGQPRIFEEAEAKLNIGNYTSIAEGCVIALGNHRIDFVSTYPFATLGKFWPSAPAGFRDHGSKGDVNIGSDVWIGSRVFISSGVTIGDGAVIGAQAVVTKDVPPYGIVTGNPAKLIRYRFDKQIIERLLRVKWWDWPEEKVDRFIPQILSSDIEAFLALAGE